MGFSFENKQVNENIITYEVFQVDKMPDMFLEVEFVYPRTPTWRTCIPIYEKYQGIDYTKSPEDDVNEWIRGDFFGIKWYSEGTRNGMVRTNQTKMDVKVALGMIWMTGRRNLIRL